MSEDSRKQQRKLVGLLVKLQHKGLDEFAAKYATNLSEGGMFIRTREPKPIGTELNFKVEIADGQRVLQGIAIVRWVRPANDPGGPQGMGLEFLKLDDASRALVDRMLGSAAPKTAIASQSSGVAPVVAPVAPKIAPPPVAVAPAKPPPPPAVEIEVEAPKQRLEIEVESVDPESAPADFEFAPMKPKAKQAQIESFAPGAVPPVEIELEVGGTAEPMSGEIDIPFDALVGTTPEPSAPLSLFDDLDATPAPPVEELPLDLDIEVEPEEPLPVLPEVTRAPPPVMEKPATPVVLREEVPAPPPAPVSRPAGATVYLKDIKPSDGTGPIIGIDLGTTNSACAILTNGRPRILNSKDGHNTIPSVVGLNKDRLVVGHRAKQQMVLNPAQSIFGAKRLVGRDFDSPTVKQVKERSHFEIVEAADRRAGVKLGNDILSLEEVQGLVLKECREMAEQSLGTPVSRAVVTCPAYYSEPQREAVRRAGAMAGLKVERVLNEPTAAALAFGMNRELTKTVLVYDLGGGTFDATILKLEQNVFEVLATGGDVFLGGVDFDNQLVDLLLERFSQWHKKPFSGDRIALSRVSDAAEKMKIALSERTSFDVHLPMLEMDSGGKPLDLRTTVTRADIEAVCNELVERTLVAVQDVLLDAKLKASQIDDIILVGGMSRMPLVREKLKAVFKKPPHASVNADEAVALGAALYSGTVDKVSSLVLIDVVPMTIGLGKPGGAFHRLIERNTPLPATKSFGISTQKNDETELEILIFQGEDSNVAGNEFVGALSITGLPKGPAGAVQVAVTVSLDAECVVTVEAKEFRTRKTVKSTLATRYTNDEIAQKLGISQAKREEATKARGEELEKRAGGFWGRLKSLFKR